MADGTGKRSTSRNQGPSSRPTTPLRPSSRTSFRDARAFPSKSGGSSTLPLETIEPAFAELSDSVADLEANFMHLQLMHESLSRFSESFASFLYGLNMNAFCVDFPEVQLNRRSRCRGADRSVQAPTTDSFMRAQQKMDRTGPYTSTGPSLTYIINQSTEASAEWASNRPGFDGETTLM